MKDNANLSTPLLPEQRRFLARRLPEAHHWNQALLLRVPAWITPSIAQQGLQLVTRNNDGLRTILMEHSSDLGEVLPQDAQLPIDLIDLSNLTEAQCAVRFTEHCTYAQSSMCLTKGPLLRLSYLVLSDIEFRILLIVHHVVCDGFSMELLLQQWERACASVAADRSLQPPPPTTSNRSYAQWLVNVADTDDLRGQYDEWLSLARPTSSVSVEWPGVNTMASTEIVTSKIDEAATLALIKRASASRSRSAIIDMLLSAIIPTLCTVGRERTMRTNLIGHGRFGIPGQPRVHRTIGWLSTRYPISMQIDMADSISTQLSIISDHLAHVPWSGAGYGLLRYIGTDIGLREGLAAMGDPEVTVNYQGRALNFSSGKIFQAAPEYPGPTETDTGLREHIHGIDIIIDQNSLQLDWYYSANQFSRNTVIGYVNEVVGRLNRMLSY